MKKVYVVFYQPDGFSKVFRSVHKSAMTADKEVYRLNSNYSKELEAWGNPPYFFEEKELKE